MNETKQAKKPKNTSISISSAKSKNAKAYCKKQGYKVQAFVDAAIDFALANDLKL